MAVQLPTNFCFNADQLTELARVIETLDRLVPGHDVHFQPRSFEPDSGSAPANSGSEASARGQSNRALVLQATAECATVEQISQRTGLKAKDIRGVLNATDLKFEVDDSGERKRYRFAGNRS